MMSKKGDDRLCCLSLGSLLPSSGDYTTLQVSKNSFSPGHQFLNFVCIEAGVILLLQGGVVNWQELLFKLKTIWSHRINFSKSKTSSRYLYRHIGVQLWSRVPECLEPGGQKDKISCRIKVFSQFRTFTKDLIFFLMPPRVNPAGEQSSWGICW